MTFNLWQLLAFLLAAAVAVVTGVWAVGRVLVGQYDRRLDERFAVRDDNEQRRSQTDAERLIDLRTRIDKLEMRQTEEIEALGRSDDRIESRLVELERAVASAPTKDDMTRLHQRIDALGQEVANLSGEFKGAADVLKLIHNKLLGQK